MTPLTDIIVKAGKGPENSSVLAGESPELPADSLPFATLLVVDVEEGGLNPIPSDQPAETGEDLITLPDPLLPGDSTQGAETETTKLAEDLAIPMTVVHDRVKRTEAQPQSQAVNPKPSTERAPQTLQNTTQAPEPKPVALPASETEREAKPTLPQADPPRSAPVKSVEAKQDAAKAATTVSTPPAQEQAEVTDSPHLRRTTESPALKETPPHAVRSSTAQKTVEQMAPETTSKPAVSGENLSRLAFEMQKVPKAKTQDWSDHRGTQTTQSRADAGDQNISRPPLAPAISHQTGTDQIATKAVEDSEPSIKIDAAPLSAERAASSVQAPQLNTSPAATADQARQIAQQLATATPQTAPGTTEVTLNPEELGRVRLLLTQSESGLSLLITADRPETADIMRRHIDQLAQSYRQMGLGDVAFSFAETTQDGSGNPANPGSAAHDTSVSPEEVEPVLPHQEQAASRRLDLRI